MEPLSSFIPKPALEVLGEPLAASAWRHLAPRCQRLVANLHRHPELVAAALSGLRKATDPPLAFSREPTLLGGAGGVAAARPLLGEGAVLVANTDTWADLDLQPLLSAYDPDGIALAVIPHPDPQRWSSVQLGCDGRVEAFEREYRGNTEPFLFTGFQLLGARVVAQLPPPPGEFAPLWEALRQRGALRAAVVTGRWREAGTLPAYLELVMSLLGGGQWCHETAEVAADVHLVDAAVGAGCRVARGTSLQACVLTRGVTLAPNCTLHRCVAAGPFTVPAGTVATDALLLPSGTTQLR
jgi:NDP-sugar pyrophosphorylase family protein